MPQLLSRQLTAVVAALAVTTACGSGSETSSEPAPPDSTATTIETTAGDTTSPTTTAGDTTSPTTTVQPPSSSAPTTTSIEYPTGIVPTRVEIPAIGVDATNVALDLSGPEPEVPTDFDQTGWYEQTRLPGEIGPAVIAGHIDSYEGPAVFARLDRLAAGDEIIVHGFGGDTRRFAVASMGQYPKDALPDEVFGFGAGEPELRLITCGGSFDRSTGHYRDNLVVYAQLVA